MPGAAPRVGQPLPTGLVGRGWGLVFHIHQHRRELHVLRGVPVHTAYGGSQAEGDPRHAADVAHACSFLVRVRVRVRVRVGVRVRFRP